MRKLERDIDMLPPPYTLLGVGIPGSGKTTGIERLVSQLDISRVSPDDIRKILSGDMSDQSRNDEVWEETQRRVRNELEEGYSLVIDATAANAEQRKQDIKLYRSFGAQAIAAIVFDVSLAVAKKRNLNPERGRIVPEPVLERMHTALQQRPPSTDEGFDAVFHYPQ
jgi:predicted kinase